MKVTISAALYNVASYVEDCVRSLYGQTMDDLEILLVDDGSSDGSIDIALRVLEDYPDRKPQVREQEYRRGSVPAIFWCSSC